MSSGVIQSRSVLLLQDSFRCFLLPKVPCTWKRICIVTRVANKDLGLGITSLNRLLPKFGNNITPASPTPVPPGSLGVPSKSTPASSATPGKQPPSKDVPIPESSTGDGFMAGWSERLAAALPWALLGLAALLWVKDQLHTVLKPLLSQWLGSAMFWEVALVAAGGLALMWRHRGQVWGQAREVAGALIAFPAAVSAVQNLQRHQQEMEAFHTEANMELNSNTIQLQQLKGELRGVRTELRAEIEELRHSLGDVRADVKMAVEALKSELTALRNDNRDAAHALRGELQVLVQRSRGDTDRLSSVMATMAALQAAMAAQSGASSAAQRVVDIGGPLSLHGGGGGDSKGLPRL